MIKHTISKVVVLTLLSSLAAHSIQPVYTARQGHAAKVRGALQKLGSGDIRVAVGLRDGRTISGRLARVGHHGFSIVELQQATSTNLSFDDVSSMRGNNLSTGAKVGIGVAAGVLVLIYCGLSEGGLCRN
jgi:hypothetical protein